MSEFKKLTKEQIIEMDSFFTNHFDATCNKQRLYMLELLHSLQGAYKEVDRLTESEERWAQSAIRLELHDSQQEAIKWFGTAEQRLTEINTLKNERKTLENRIYGELTVVYNHELESQIIKLHRQVGGLKHCLSFLQERSCVKECSQRGGHYDYCITSRKVLEGT